MPAWIRFESTFREHVKFDRLARRLGIHPVMARGHVAILWAWAINYAPDGDLRGFEADEIASAARWEGDASAFIAAMVHVKLLDKSESGLIIHEYLERALTYKDAVRKANSRINGQDVHNSSGTDSGHGSDSPGLARARTDRPDRPTEKTDRTDPRAGANGHDRRTDPPPTGGRAGKKPAHDPRPLEHRPLPEE